MDMIVHNEKQQQIVTDDLQDDDCMNRNCQKITFITSIHKFLWLSPVSGPLKFICRIFYEILLWAREESLTTCDAMNFMTNILRLWVIVRAQVSFFWRLFITWLIFDVKIIKIKINIDTYKQYDNIMMVITIIINPLNSKQHPHTHIACKSLIFSHYNMSC